VLRSSGWKKNARRLKDINIKEMFKKIREIARKGPLPVSISVRVGGAPPVLKNFRAKILNDKKYIFNTVNSGQTLFSGQAQVAQKS